MSPADTQIPILLVEDDLDQAHLVKFLLEAGGDYAVTLAQDGDRALKLLDQGPWKLVITDLNLPGADGTAVVAAARSAHPDLPILATTGYTGPEYAQRASELGADAVMVKPLDRDDLLSRVRDLLSGKQRRFAPSANPQPTPTDEPAPAPDPEPNPEPTPEPTPEPEPPAGGRPDQAGLQVLAIGVRPGDVEAGCGGTLHRHRARGHQVVILHLGTGAPDRDQATRRDAAREAGQRLGVRTFVGSAADQGEGAASELQRLSGGAVREIRPDVLYIPSLTHPERAHRIAHRAAADAAPDRTVVLAYDPGDLPPTFTPTWFSVVEGDPLERKIQALGEYEERDLSVPGGGERTRIHADYWGRHSHHRPSEPFERIGGEPPPLEGVTLTLPDLP
ncbi:MAG: response regulator [Gemmatimonadales bacterium]|nr:MAG: response regulator [Gemmatimonadales bacterium]